MKNNEIKFHFELEQQTPEWFELKLAKMSASEIHKIIWAKTITQGAETYIQTKISELFTSEIRGFESHYCDWGNLYEPVASDFYEKAEKEKLSKVAFITNTKFKNCGVSPDRINLDIKKGYEIKCPEAPVNHWKYIKCKNSQDLKKVKKEYYWQILMCLLITEFDSWQFISYYPNFEFQEKDLRMWSFEINRNEFSVSKDLELLSDRLKEADEYYEKELKSEL